MKKENMTLQERDQKFNLTKGLGYGLAFGNNILAGYFITFVTYFCTNSLLISATAIGVVMGISTVTDGFSDLFAGYILERTNTRYGKARPYLIFGILMWIPLILIFCTPNVSKTMMLVWIFIFFTLQKSVFQTMYSICFNVLLKRTVVDDNSRLKTISFQTIFQMLIGMIVGIVMPIAIDKVGGDQKSWIMIAVVLGVIGSLMSLFAFFACKEYTDEELKELGVSVTQDAENKVTLKNMLKVIGKNKYFLMYLLMYGIIALVNAISSVSGTYYFSVNVGNLRLMSIATVITFVLYPLFAVYPKMVTKIGIHKFVYIMAGLTIAGTVVRMLSGTNTVGIMVGSLFAGFGAATNYVFPLIVLKCMEYSEVKYGLPAEGAYSAMQGFLYKIVTALGSTILGFILTLGHYDGALATQPQTAYTAINFVYNIFPIAAYALIIILISFSDPTKEIEEIKNK